MEISSLTFDRTIFFCLDPTIQRCEFSASQTKMWGVGGVGRGWGLGELGALSFASKLRSELPGFQNITVNEIYRFWSHERDEIRTHFLFLMETSGKDSFLCRSLAPCSFTAQRCLFDAVRPSSLAAGRDAYWIRVIDSGRRMLSGRWINVAFSLSRGMK